MNRSLLTAVALVVAVPHTFAQGITEAQLKVEKTRVSYAIGLNMGRSLTHVKDQVDLMTLVMGIEDQIANKAALTDRQIIETLDSFAASYSALLAAGNQETGGKFLLDNKNRAGVKSTASGLQFEVLVQGKGAQPRAADTVKVHYLGKLINGAEFDSTFKRNEPSQFDLNQLKAGWKGFTEGLLLMPVGSKYKFYVPSDLAYGENGPPSIGPNQTLIFEVELLGIVKTEVAQTETN